MDDGAENTPKTRKRRGPALSVSARKRHRKEKKQKANFGRISLGLEFERWKKVKEEDDLKTHADVAKFLLDKYYSKKSGRWSIFSVKDKKDYTYVKDIACIALTMRINDRIGMHRRVLEEDDPRRLAYNLAPTEPAAMGELAKEKHSRF